MVSAENVSAVVLDVPKNAVPVGTIAGFQLVAVLKSPDVGLGSQVASCALAVPGANAVTATSAVVASSAPRRQFQPLPDNLDGAPPGAPLWRPSRLLPPFIAMPREAVDTVNVLWDFITFPSLYVKFPQQGLSWNSRV